MEPGGWVVVCGEPIYTGTGLLTGHEAEILAEYWEMKARWEEERREKGG